MSGSQSAVMSICVVCADVSMCFYIWVSICVFVHVCFSLYIYLYVHISYHVYTM